MIVLTGNPTTIGPLIIVISFYFRLLTLADAPRAITPSIQTGKQFLINHWDLQDMQCTSTIEQQVDQPIDEPVDPPFEESVGLIFAVVVMLPVHIPNAIIVEVPPPEINAKPETTSAPAPRRFVIVGGVVNFVGFVVMVVCYFFDYKTYKVNDSHQSQTGVVQLQCSFSPGVYIRRRNFDDDNVGVNMTIEASAVLEWIKLG
ncbi:hypothetical protein L1887_05508 [Cichorium endivia]|nr:hypothetical protein L1887_05508 [Cichorium endivia]